jgi:hypothetical protein
VTSSQCLFKEIFYLVHADAETCFSKEGVRFPFETYTLVDGCQNVLATLNAGLLENNHEAIVTLDISPI